MTDQPALPVTNTGRRCAHCGKHTTYLRREINPPDDSTLVWKFFCSVACDANWGTNQLPPTRTTP